MKLYCSLICTQWHQQQQLWLTQQAAWRHSAPFNHTPADAQRLRGCMCVSVCVFEQRTAASINTWHNLAWPRPRPSQAEPSRAKSHRCLKILFNCQGNKQKMRFLWTTTGSSLAWGGRYRESQKHTGLILKGSWTLITVKSLTQSCYSYSEEYWFLKHRKLIDGHLVNPMIDL